MTCWPIKARSLKGNKIPEQALRPSGQPPDEPKGPIDVIVINPVTEMKATFRITRLLLSKVTDEERLKELLGYELLQAIRKTEEK